MSLDLRERKREMARQGIVEAAYELFSRHGFDGTTVEMIAERALVSPRTVFRYFLSKESIVFAGFDGHGDELIEIVRRRCAAGVAAPVVFAAFAELLGRRQQEPSFLVLTALMRDNPALTARADAWRRQLSCRVAEELARLRGEAGPSLHEKALAGTAVAVSALAIEEWARNEHRGDLAEAVLRAGQAIVETLAT